MDRKQRRKRENHEQGVEHGKQRNDAGKRWQVYASSYACNDKTLLETVRVVMVVACRCGATWTARIYLLTQALPLLPDTGTRGGRAGTDTVTPPRPPLDPSMNRQNRTDSQTRACDHATDTHGGLLMVVG